MLVIRGVLQEELERQQRMLKAYLAKLEALPKGNIVPKKVNGRNYSYLQFRSGRRVVSQYIPESELPIIKAKIEERKRYQKTVRDIQKEIKFIQKALKIKV
ncbi:hypothetical protein [Zhaonella formicivorans]|uniref:hypothetical protein n=1 Tax=Zhaonella formicivorans TaxID=2528593 RepID=UPI0010D148BD|nr:hypothetical protein [Zhaonella formicivorans]